MIEFDFEIDLSVLVSKTSKCWCYKSSCASIFGNTGWETSGWGPVGIKSSCIDWGGLRGVNGNSYFGLQGPGTSVTKKFSLDPGEYILVVLASARPHYGGALLVSIGDENGVSKSLDLSESFKSYTVHFTVVGSTDTSVALSQNILTGDKTVLLDKLEIQRVPLSGSSQSPSVSPATFLPNPSGLL